MQSKFFNKTMKKIFAFTLKLINNENEGWSILCQLGIKFRHLYIL